MSNHTYIMSPCQFCEQLERRAIWREGKLATCINCKMARRSELIKLKRRDARPSSAEASDARHVAEIATVEG
jgi:hypothetical protein